MSSSRVGDPEPSDDTRIRAYTTSRARCSGTPPRTTARARATARAPRRPSRRLRRAGPRRSAGPIDVPIGRAVDRGRAAPLLSPTPARAARRRAVSFGPAALDEASGGGALPGRLVLVVGAPGAGAGLLAAGTVVSATPTPADAPDSPSAVLSRMPGRPRADIAARLTAAAAGVDHRRLRAGTFTDTERHAADAASTRLAAGALLLDDGADLTLDLLREAAADIAGLRLAAVDPLNQLLPAAAGLPGLDVRRGVAALRRPAADLDMPVVAVWEARADEPLEVGAALAQADTVIQLTREGEQAFAIVAERDLGPIAQAALHAGLAHVRFTDLDRLERDRPDRAGAAPPAPPTPPTAPSLPSVLLANEPRADRTALGRRTGDLTPYADRARTRNRPPGVDHVEGPGRDEEDAQGRGGHRRGPAARGDCERGGRGTRRGRGRYDRRGRGVGPSGDPGRMDSWACPAPSPGTSTPGIRRCRSCCVSAATRSRTRCGRPAPSGHRGRLVVTTRRSLDLPGTRSWQRRCRPALR
ncbi:DnaB helicase C-terminal domain-containing protein (plasmid) [Embleya sp. NBC_00888]|nr:DnaB helicase C-terminal domain-containing protein [Embleya sp. NBC_00888]